MSGPQPPPVVSPACPDLLQHVEGSSPPPSPSTFFRSFFEEECRAIISRLFRDSAAEPAPHRDRDSLPRPAAAPPATSTPLWDPPAAEPRRLRPPGTGALPARKAARGRAAPGPGRSRTPRRTPGRGRAARAGAKLPEGGRGLGAPGTELPQPRGSKLKAMPGTKSRIQQLAQRSTIPKPKARDTQMECNSAAAAAAKAGGHRQPSQRLSTAIPTMASHSRLRLLGKVSSPKRFCFGKADQTWELGVSSFSSKLAPGDAVPAEESAGDQLSGELKCQKKEPECAKNEWEQVRNKMEQVTNELERAKKEWEQVTNKMEQVTKELEQVTNELERVKSESESAKNELKYVKNELEQVKTELADKTAQCEAYHRTILQAQLRATGICPEDGAVEKGGDLGTDLKQPLVQMPEPLGR
ncbi:atherin-like isoform X2 [Cuculus canorus]|uniref:atherin-like isoform X2 n=1 Tax=Cuculus canorus TaxID=55661 RepID=UPI0023AAC655|nr:atherin-like isoform X2 [Cuculus canorus]